MIEKSIAASCEALGVDGLTGALLHRGTDIRTPGVVETLQSMVHRGTLGAYGVSVYDPAVALDAIKHYGATMVQAPMNALDLRVEESGLAAACADRQVTLFARSAFLQGLLFKSADQLPKRFASESPLIAAMHKIARAAGVPLARLSLQRVMGTPGVSSVVVGGERADQVIEVCRWVNEPPLDHALITAIDETIRSAGGAPAWLIDPSQW